MKQVGPGFMNFVTEVSQKLRKAFCDRLSLMLNHFSCVLLFATRWTVPARLLCLWDSPGKNAGVGCHVLFQVNFLTQGSNPYLLCLPHWQVGSLPPALPRTVEIYYGFL